MKEKFFCPICSGLEEEIISHLLNSSIVRSFNAHDYIYMQGADYKGLFAITKGNVELSNLNEDGKKVFVSKLSSNETFGESGAADSTYLENAYSLTPTTCIFIPAESLKKLMTAYPELSSAVFAALNKWLITFYNRFKILSQGDIRRRLEIYLLNESKKFNSNVFEINLHKHEVASNLGIRAETLSRLLKELTVKGKISMNGKQVDISPLIKTS